MPFTKKSLTILGFAFVTSLALVGAAQPVHAESSKTLSVKRLVLARGVANHEPSDATTTFKQNDDRVYAFIEVENRTKEKSGVSVVFVSPKGEAMGAIPLTVGESSRFRTWAFTRKAHEVGEWSVIVREDGKHDILARQTFTVAK